jgi:hypothetical protein
MSRRDIRGASLHNWKITAALLGALILLCGSLTLGLYFGGFRYLRINYVHAPDGATEQIVFMGFIEKDGGVKSGNITCTDGKKGEVERLSDGTYRITYQNGDLYEGGLDGLQRSGKGRLTYASGDLYEGEFYADKPHGKGVYRYASGDLYEGSFSSGKKSGLGVYTWMGEDGEAVAVYNGYFANDKRNGYGEFSTSDGTIYKGRFVNDKREDDRAEVTFKVEGGTDRYYGGYKSDVRSGFGYYFYASGDVYVGDFANNKPHGEGTVYFVNGGSYKGRFENGNVLKDEVAELPADKAEDLGKLDPEKNPLK